jgi:transposase
MSREELRAQHERLIVQVGSVLEQKPPLQAQQAELVQALQALAQEYDRKLAEAEAQIAELKRELFGPKADRLTREQQKQFDQLVKDVEVQNQQPAAESDEILFDQEPAEGRKKQRQPRVRHSLPVQLETQTVTLEPQLQPCACCGKMPAQIGEEITEEIDLIPAKLIRRRTIRPKYACCCGEAGVAIAPLPPRLIPQSRLALGLAVHILLSRFDDHLSFYRLEQQCCLAIYLTGDLYH